MQLLIGITELPSPPLSLSYTQVHMVFATYAYIYLKVLHLCTVCCHGNKSQLIRIDAKESVKVVTNCNGVGNGWCYLFVFITSEQRTSELCDLHFEMGRSVILFLFLYFDKTEKHRHKSYSRCLATVSHSLLQDW